jgi:branched-chain amino acid transport system permease protein
VTPIVQHLVSGLALGAAYALVALGFVVIYRASQVFNFAQGELLAFGAFSMVTFTELSLPWPVALACTMGCTGLLGMAVERSVVRPLIGRPVFVPIILTIFVGLALRSIIHVAWGTDVRGMPTPWETTATVEIAGASVLYNSIGALVAGAAALVTFYVLLRYTKLGVAMRATNTDQETALAQGIPVGRIFALTWFIAGAYAALAGVFLGMFPRGVDTNLGFVGLRAFPAAIVGGLDSVWGTVIAGLLLGCLEVLAGAYLNQHLGDFGHNFQEVFPYVVMILFLIVRPYGLFGTEEVKRV